MNLDYSTILGLPNNTNHIKDIVKKENANLSKELKKDLEEIYLHAAVGCVAGGVLGGPLSCAVGASANVASSIISKNYDTKNEKSKDNK